MCGLPRAFAAEVVCSRETTHLGAHSRPAAVFVAFQFRVLPPFSGSRPIRTAAGFC